MKADMRFPGRCMAVPLMVLAVVLSACATGGNRYSESDPSLAQLAREAQAGETGAGVGAGVPYILGNSVDQQRAMELLKASPSQNYPTHSQTFPLGNTRWTVAEVEPAAWVAAYSNVAMEFKSNGRLITTATHMSGREVMVDECYRVIKDVLAISRRGYIANYEYTLDSNHLYIETGRIKVRMERVR